MPCWKSCPVRLLALRGSAGPGSHAAETKQGGVVFLFFFSYIFTCIHFNFHIQLHGGDYTDIIPNPNPWKESYNKPRQCIKNQRHHFADKGPYSQSYGFSVVTYRCESWTTKKAERQRIDTFKLYHWRRFLRVPWTARSNQSILKEINPEYSLEGLMLKLQYFGHLMQRTESLEKTLKLGKIEGRRRRQQRMKWLGGIIHSVDTS